MRRLIVFILGIFLFEASFGQKNVVGSVIPTVKSMKDEIVWLNDFPDKETFRIIEFYQPENKSCVANLERLKSIVSAYGEYITVLILTKESDLGIHQFAESAKEFFSVGIDTTGNGYFEKCYVQYLPYTIFVDQNNKLVWHGFLSGLSNEMIEEKIQYVKN